MPSDTTALSEPEHANPYVGPRPFTEQDGTRFYGRQREARDLLARVVSERLLVFYAQSGAGKSSLLYTRLIPGLRDQEGFGVLPVGRVSGKMPPGIDAVDNVYLFHLMSSLDQSDAHPARLAHLPLSDFLNHLVGETVIDETGKRSRRWVYRPEVTVGETFGQPTPPQRQRFVLIIDQFEEIVSKYGEHWEERTDFFRQLNQAMRADPNLWVVLTLREDYLAALDPYRALLDDKLRARFRMDRMRAEAALEAIKQPADRAGRPFAPGVAERLVDDLRQVRITGQKETYPDQYVEPVQLQVVCYRLWDQVAAARAQIPDGQRASEDQITQADLGAAGDVSEALEQFYADTLRAVVQESDVVASGVTERALRSWFDQELITETGIRNTLLSTEADGKTGSLPNVAVEALNRRFLLHTESRGGGIRVELVHDRFVEPIRVGNAAWFAENLSPLQRQAALWIDEGRPNDLLLSGGTLADAEKWAAAHEKELTQNEKDFLAASREKRNRYRMQVGALLLIAGLGLLAMGFGLFARQQREVALANEATAEANALAARSAQATAIANADEATRQKAQAETQRNAALVAEAQARALLVQQQLAVDPIAGLHLATHAVPSAAPNRQRPLVPAAEYALQQAIHGSNERAFLQSINRPLTSKQVAWQPGETMGLLAVGGEQGELEIIDRDWSTHIISTGLTAEVGTVLWSDDGARLLVQAGEDLQVWPADVLDSSSGAGPAVCGYDIHCTSVTNVEPNCAAWQPSGDRVALCRQAKSPESSIVLWSVPPEVTAGISVMLPASIFADAIEAVSWSPDGRWLTATDGKSLRIWQAKREVMEPANVYALPCATAPRCKTAMQWSPAINGGAEYLVATTPGYVHVWSPDSSEVLRTVKLTTSASEPYTSQGIRFIDDSRFVLWSNRDAPQLHNVDGTSPISTFGPSSQNVTNVWISPSQDEILLALEDGSLQRFAIGASPEMLTGLTGHGRRITTLAWHPARPYLATAALDGTARIWSMETDEQIAVLYGHQNADAQEALIDVLDIRWLDEKRVITYGEDGSFRIWQVFDGVHDPCVTPDGQLQQFCQSYPVPGIESAGWSGSGYDALWTIGFDGGSGDYIGQLSLESRDFTTTTTGLQPLRSPYSELLIDSRGNYILTRSPTGEESIDIVSLPGGETAATITEFAGDEYGGGAAWVGEDLLISRRQTADHPPDMALVDPATGAVKRTFGSAEGNGRPVDLPVWTAALASDGRLASFHTDDFDRYELAVWDSEEAAQPKQIWSTVEDVPSGVSHLAWPSGGNHLVALYIDGGLGIYEAGTGTVLWQCTPDDSCSLENRVAAAEFSPNGEQLAVAHMDTVSVLDAATGYLLWEVKTQDNTVQGLTWIEAPPWPGATDHAEPVRLLLLTWSGDGTARLWDEEHLAEIARYTGLDSITDAALSPDGRHLLLVSENRGVNVWRFWPLDPEAMLATADCLITRGLTPAQVQELGMPEDASVRPVCTRVMGE